MKRSHSDNNLDNESIQSDGGNNMSSGSGSNAGGNYRQKRYRNEENVRLLIPSRVSFLFKFKKKISSIFIVCLVSFDLCDKDETK